MKVKTIYLIILAVLLISFCIVMFSAFSNITAHTSADIDDDRITVIIDAGHGGEDGGAEVDGILEKDINLSIADKLADTLRLCGVRVTEIRDEDISVYDDSAQTLREKKVSDLKHRVEIVNGSENNILSLLQNDNTRELKPANSDIYLLDNATVPAVIVECGFLSNDEERAKMLDSGYQSEMAYSIAMGVLEYIDQ